MAGTDVAAEASATTAHRRGQHNGATTLPSLEVPVTRSVIER